MSLKVSHMEIDHKRPFTIGRIPLELTQQSLQAVRSDILSWFKNNEALVSVSNEKKCKIDTKKDCDLFSQFVGESSSDTKRLITDLNSPLLRRQILSSIWGRIISNRRDRYWLELMLLGLFNWDFFETRLELSVMGRNSSIVPHTDSIGKIFSGLIYLPTEEQRHTSDTGNLGTSFWDSDIKNFENRHLTTERERFNFYRRAKLITQTPFDNSHMWFFIRNTVSWHSVEELTSLEADEKRVSINYNILLRGSVLKRLTRACANKLTRK